MNTSSPRAPRGFDSAHFRQALSQFATGVTVITTRLADGSFRGLTASSFNSVSLEPPLVLWSLATTANSLPIFSGNSHYVINVLSAGQEDLARRFSRRGEDPFARHRLRTLAHRPADPERRAAWFECHNRSRYPEGDHVIFVGEVEECACSRRRPCCSMAGASAGVEPGPSPQRNAQ
jgi:flavin reductase (DIM6/NTAB) family NADH-FMN oxidoreductase RutF